MNTRTLARTALCLLALVFGGFACAASLSERSPVRPGLWWDASHEGSGFEIHTAPGQLFVIWYTYRPDGSPVWYTAQSPFSAEGRFDAPLLRHQWKNGRYAGATTVGRLALTRTNAESLDARFTIDGAGGGWTISPYLIAGATPEIDHTGAFFDPSASGYGLTLGEQGAWLTAAYYAYDASGEPTWVFGTNAGEGASLQLDRFKGACPSCAAETPRATGSINLALDLRTETALAARFSGGSGVLPDEWRHDASLSMLTTPASRRPADRTLASFDDATTLKSYLREGLLHEAPATTFDFSPPPAALSYSSTNLVEAGVDEADAVKTDGRYVYTFDVDPNGYGRRAAALRVAVIQGDGPQVMATSSTALPNIPGDALTNPQLFLTPERLVAVASTAPRYYFFGPAGILPPRSYENMYVHVEVLDRASDPLTPRPVFRATLDGALLSSRRIGDQLYVVHRFVPYIEATDGGTRAGAIDATPADKLLPQISVDGNAPAPMLGASSVLLPPTASIRPTPELACVTRFNLANPSDHETLAIAGPVSAVYVSNTNLYVATTRYEPLAAPIAGLEHAGYTATDVHQVALDSGHPRFVASGAVEGYVDRDFERAPFRLSERDGRLRIVTAGDFQSGGTNRVTVLERSAIANDVLRTVSSLPNRLRPEPIGRRDELIYGTRFVDDTLYAVTFHKTDPLYVVALDSPADPRIAGEIELPGFSDYLHPLPNGLLLGVGKDSIAAPMSPGGDPIDWYQGVKVTLFDVRQPATPQVLDSRVIGRRGTDTALLRSHHAFSALPLAGGAFRFAIPIRENDGVVSQYPDPWDFFPYLRSGLYAFEVDPTRGAAARLAAFPPLITARASDQALFDDATSQARSVLLPSGAIYVAGGRFYFAPWSDLAHPAGPY